MAVELLTLVYLEAEVDAFLLNKSDTNHNHVGVYQPYDLNTVVDASYVHTDNNFTTALKTNYDLAYTHSQSAHAPTDADNTATNETSHTDVLVEDDIGISVLGTELVNLVSVNLNTQIASGRYITQNNCSNIPEAEVAFLVVIRDVTNTDSIGQFFFSHTSNKQWLRKTENAGATWSTWAIIYQPYDVNIVSDANYIATENNFTTLLKNSYDSHIIDTAKHFLQSEISITESQVSDLGTYETALGFTPENVANKGASDGYAELVGGTVPSSQLPAYVDDVIEFADEASFPATGESGKIYVALDVNLTFRWTGTVYTEISASIALGETSATAYRGDFGKIAYEHSQAVHAPIDADNTSNNETTHADVLVDTDTLSPVTVDNKLITESDVLGGGDMLKTTYDNSGTDGIVDNAEKVNGLTVETAVPSNAEFTDTIYDPTAIQSEVDLNSAKITYPISASDKLATIEDSATSDQTDIEIKTAYENNANTNEFSDAEQTKLAGLESSHFKGQYVDTTALNTAHPTASIGDYANVDGGVGNDVLRYIWDDDDTVWVEQLGSSAVLSDAQIKTQYENNADTNAYTDTEKSKLSGIEDSANVNLSTIEMEAVISHDNLQNINADEHIDWSLTNVKNIHADNYTDTNTTYSIQDGELSQNNLTDALKTQYDLAEANNADTVLYNVSGSFTASQRATFVTTEDMSIAFDSGNNISFTATAISISVVSQTAGQSGTLVIDSADLITGWSTEFDWGYQGVPTDLNGLEKFGYTIISASGVGSIVIGRV